jgi:hypothetical protein
MSFQSNMKSLQPRRLQFQKKIKLLSGGFARPESFPNGEITVYPWDANADDWMADRVRKGDKNTVMFDMCAHLCNLNGCKIDDFITGDVNTVLLVSRALRYDSVVEYECTCPNANCGNVTREEIKIPDELGRLGEKTSDYPGFDEITLPDCKDVVRLRLLAVRDEKSIMDRDLASKALMSDRVAHIVWPITSINGGSPDTWEEVQRWYQALSPTDSESIEEQENLLYPHLNTAIPHVCDICRRKFKYSLDFNTEFFRASLLPVNGTPLAPDVQPGVERTGANTQSKGSAGPVPGVNGWVG